MCSNVQSQLCAQCSEAAILQLISSAAAAAEEGEEVQKSFKPQPSSLLKVFLESSLLFPSQDILQIIIFKTIGFIIITLTQELANIRWEPKPPINAYILAPVLPSCFVHCAVDVSNMRQTSSSQKYSGGSDMFPVRGSGNR